MGAIHGNPSALSLFPCFCPSACHASPGHPSLWLCGGKSERKNLIMISFRSNEALVLGPSVSYRPAGCPAQGVRRAGSGGGRQFTGCRMCCQAFVVVVAVVVVLFCNCSKKTNNLTLSPARFYSSSCSSSFAALPLLSHRYPSLCWRCPVILSSSTRLDWTRRRLDSPCAAVDNG